MIIVMRAGATAAQVDGVREHVEGRRGAGGGARTYLARDGGRAVIGCLGDVEALTQHGGGALGGGGSGTTWRTPPRLASRAPAPPRGRAIVPGGGGPGAGPGGPGAPGVRRAASGGG